MRVRSLFSGIGGFDLAFEQAGYQLAWMCEIEPFPRKVLAKRFPAVPVYEDVTRLNGKEVPPVDVLVGGFPLSGLVGGRETRRIGRVAIGSVLGVYAPDR